MLNVQPYPESHPFHFLIDLVGIVLLTCFLLLPACTGGYLVTEDQIEQIQVGVSSQDDVRKVLGEPMKIAKSDDSDPPTENWIYPLSKYASDPHTGVPPIGVVGAPISRAHRKTTEVTIRFDEYGIVKAIEERRPPQ